MTNPPGYDGKYLPVHDTVDNPYRKGESETVVRNLRESNTYTLRLGPAQERAYNKFWELCYKAGYSKQMAIDPSNEPVDGGGFRDPIPASALDGATKLGRISNEPSHQEYPGIGKEKFHLIWATCIIGLGYKEIANIEFGESHKRSDVDFVRFNVKASYNDLARYFGYSGEGPAFARLRAYMGE